jgi:hypothetical protein
LWFLSSCMTLLVDLRVAERVLARSSRFIMWLLALELPGVFSGAPLRPLEGMGAVWGERLEGTGSWIRVGCVLSIEERRSLVALEECLSAGCELLLR